jgi:hypothetical protein
MGDGGPWTSNVWFTSGVGYIIDIPDREIFSHMLDILATKKLLASSSMFSNLCH